MNSATPLTRLSLVMALQNPDDHDGWGRFALVYGDVIRRWCLDECHRRGIPNANDVADHIQLELLACIREKMKSYDLTRYRPDTPGQFRAWLRRVTINELRDHCRQLPQDRATGGTSAYDVLAAQPAREELADRLDLVFLQDLFQTIILPRVRAEFQEHQWTAVMELGLEDGRAGGRSGPSRTTEVAVKYGYKVSSLLRLKSDILRRIHEVRRELLPEDDR